MADALANNNILRISDQQTIRLIELYQREECLWNTNSLDYKNKQKRALAAQRIAAELDIPNFTAQHVIMKFKNLRNSYSQELKKIAHSHQAGRPEYRPRVMWYSKMDSFIRPHLQPARGLPPESLVYWERTGSGAGSEDDERAGDAKRLCVHPPGEAEPETDYLDHFGRYVAGLLRALPPARALALQPQLVRLITDQLHDALAPTPPAPSTPSSYTPSDHLSMLCEVHVKTEVE